MQVLVAHAGLVLNPGQMADLVLSWRQLAALIGGIARDRPLADDLASGFRLPPPPEPTHKNPAKRPGAGAHAKPEPTKSAQAKVRRAKVGRSQPGRPKGGPSAGKRTRAVR